MEVRDGEFDILFTYYLKLVITIEPGDGEIDYPDIVSIFSTVDPSQNYTPAVRACFGQYLKIAGKIHKGKPVWKHIEHESRVLYYAGNAWFVNAKIEGWAGWITVATNNETLPRKGWKWATNGNWYSEPSINLEGRFTQLTVGMIRILVQHPFCRFRLSHSLGEKSNC